MPDFSAIIPEAYQNISFGYLEVLIQDQRQELFSGLMRISYPSGENFVFMFLEGVQQNLYRCTESTTEIVNLQSWPQVLNRPSASVGFLPMSLDGLRLMRIIHEAPVSQMEQVSLSNSELVNSFKAWADSPEPSFIHIRSGAVHRLHVFVGSPNLVVEELSVTDGQARFSIGGESISQTLLMTDYEVSRYISIAEHDTWREYKLRLAFHSLMRMLINRFGELAGRVLAERLGGQLTDWAGNSGWKMSITSNGVVNRQYFDSLNEAVSVYVGIFRQFRDEASPAVGSRLVENMFRDSLGKLPANFGNVVSTYIYEQFGLGSPALVTQKENTKL